MKQVLQSLKNGETRVADVPVLRVSAEQVIIASTQTLVSAGKELSFQVSCSNGPECYEVRRVTVVFGEAGRA